MMISRVVKAASWRSAVIFVGGAGARLLFEVRVRSLVLGERGPGVM